MPTRLSHLLLSLAIEYEAEAEVSLTIAANVLRVVGPEPRPVRELPLAARVSKEAVGMSTTWLGNEGYVTVEAGPSSRGRVVALTAEGREGQEAHGRRDAEVERRWEERLPVDAVAALRSTLQSILDEPGGPDGPLSAGLIPPAGGWRGKGRYMSLTDAYVHSPRDHLPHYPMVLHRGGWPDGS